MEKSRWLRVIGLVAALAWGLVVVELACAGCGYDMTEPCYSQGPYAVGGGTGGATDATEVAFCVPHSSGG